MPEQEQVTANYQEMPQEGDKILGAKEKKNDRRNLMMVSIVDPAKIEPKMPDIVNWQTRYKRPFTPYHTQRYGSCTISSQAEQVRVFARREQFGRDIFIPEADIDKRYFDLTQRLYGGGDQGAYELDALNDWRVNGFSLNRRKYIIDGFTEVSIAENLLKVAIFVFRGIKICYAVTQTMYHANPGDIVHNDNSAVIGYHSMYSHGFQPEGLWMTHTWNQPPQLFAWDFVLARATEAYSCVDSKDIRLQEMANLKKFSTLKKEAVDAPASEA